MNTPQTVEGRMAAAARAGRSAARAGARRDSNPHDRDHEDPRVRVEALMWWRGWDDGNPMPLLDDDPDD